MTFSLLQRAADTSTTMGLVQRFRLWFLQEIHLASKQFREGKHFHSGFGP